MKLSTILARLPMWFESGQCYYLRSSPGRGKTTSIKRVPELVEKRNGKKLGLVIINGGLLTPMDVLGFGLPKHFENHSEMVFSLPFFWRTTEGKRLEEYPDGGIVFVDEADKMETDAKKVVGEGALSGRFGPHQLPPGWVVWMAGNRSGDRSGSTKELDHLINRRREIDITDDIESLIQWMSENGCMPLTIAFAQQNPQVVFQDGVPDEQRPWCTPRSLVEQDKYLQLLAADNNGVVPDDPATIEEISGGMGTGETQQYFTFVRLEREMPKYERILAEPDKVKVPDRPDAAMLICYNLAHRVKKEDAEPVVTYVKRLPKEFAVTFAKAACQRDWSLITTPAITKWARENASLMTMITGLNGGKK